MTGSPLLLDTSAVIGLFERRAGALRSLIASIPQVPYLSVLTVGELEHGAQVADDPDVAEVRRRTLTIAAQFEVLAPDVMVEPQCYGFILASAQPRTVGVVDRWILASAAVHGMTLATEDATLRDVAATVEWSAQGWERPVVVLSRDDELEWPS